MPLRVPCLEKFWSQYTLTQYIYILQNSPPHWDTISQQHWFKTPQHHPHYNSIEYSTIGISFGGTCDIYFTCNLLLASHLGEQKHNMYASLNQWSWFQHVVLFTDFIPSKRNGCHTWGSGIHSNRAPPTHL